jgi:hypothetical protein
MKTKRRRRRRRRDGCYQYFQLPDKNSRNISRNIYNLSRSVSQGIFSVASDGTVSWGWISLYKWVPGKLLGGGGGGVFRRAGGKGDDLTTLIVSKVMKNPEALTFWVPKGLFRPEAGQLYLYLCINSTISLGNPNDVLWNPLWEGQSASQGRRILFELADLRLSQRCCCDAASFGRTVIDVSNDRRTMMAASVLIWVTTWGHELPNPTRKQRDVALTWSMSEMVVSSGDATFPSKPSV